MGLKLRVFVGVALVAGVAACVRPGGGAPAPQPKRAHDLITADELDATRENNLFDAVARLRPHMLRNRTTLAYGREATSPVMVYVDGEKVDGLDYLRRLATSEVQEVRYFEPQIANTRFARYNNAGGAIAIVLRTSVASADST